MCFSIRPLSDSSVLAFFGACRRVISRPASASAQYSVAQLGHRLRLPLGLLVRSGIGALHHLAQQPAGFLARRVRRPGCTVAADRVAPLPPLGRAEHQDIGHRIAASAAGHRSRHRRVPHLLTRPEGAHLAQSNPLPLGHLLRLRFATLAAT